MKRNSGSGSHRWILVITASALAIVVSLVGDRIFMAEHEDTSDAPPKPPTVSSEPPESIHLIIGHNGLLIRTESFVDMEECKALARRERPGSPSLISRVAPDYPMDALYSGLEGCVTLKAAVLSDGTVGSVEVIDSNHEIFDEPSVIAVQQFKYDVNSMPRGQTDPIIEEIILTYEIDYGD